MKDSQSDIVRSFWLDKIAEKDYRRWENWVSEDVTLTGLTRIDQQAQNCFGLLETQLYFQRWSESLSDLEWRLDALFHQHHRVALELHFSGMHTGYFLGARPTGKPLEVSFAAHFDVRSDRIRHIWLIADTLQIIKQLGHVHLDPFTRAMAPWH